MSVSHRLWTPAFVGLSIANLASSAIFYLLVPAMASYAVSAFGATPVEAGTLASIFFLGALAARLVSGWAVEALGPRLLARAAVTFYLVTTILYLVAPTLGWTMLVRFWNGFGFGLLGSALTSGVLMTVPPARRSEGAGWFGVGVSLATGLGPYLALTLAAGPGGMRAVFATAIGAASLSFALLMVFGHGLPGRPATASDESAVPRWRTLLERRAMGMATVMLLGGFAYSAILTYLDQATEQTPLAWAAGIFFLVYAAVVMVWRPFGGVLQDRLGEPRILLPSYAAFAAALLLVTLATTGWHLLAAAVLLGLGWGTVTTGGQAAVASRVPRERTGAAVATYFFMLDLGTGVGPIVMGLIVDPVGYTGVFALATAVALLMAPVYLADLRRGMRP